MSQADHVGDDPTDVNAGFDRRTFPVVEFKPAASAGMLPGTEMVQLDQVGGTVLFDTEPAIGMVIRDNPVGPPLDFTLGSQGISKGRFMPLFPDDLDENPLPAPAVELPVKNLFPRAEVEFAVGDGHHHFAPHDLPFHVRVGVIFTGAVVPITGHRFVGRKLFQPVVVILDQAVFSIVDVDAGGDVHGIDEAEAFLHPAFADQILNLAGDIEVIPAMWRLKAEMFGQRFHAG